MPLKTSKIAASLLKKSFVQKETHHSYYLLFVNGKKTSIRTRLSHGSSEYGSNLLSMMKKQLSLETMEELEDLINCPMSGEAYVELLLERNVIKL